ncbi:MAG: hypothetical protein QXS12_07305, partial [Candidatus Caldarchaeum sp.]
EQLRAGDLVSIRTAGGGGWGDPKQRDPEKVLEDVKEGYITAEQALKIYGVALKEGRRIDWEQTRKLREK